MNDEYKRVVRLKNDPVSNRLTAPEKALYRPKIFYHRAALFILCLVVFTFILSHLSELLLERVNLVSSVSLESPLVNSYSLFFLWFIILNLRSLKFSLIFLIRLYQRYARSETRLRCCFIPSCSEYGVIVLQKYGAVLGMIKILIRLKQCALPNEHDLAQERIFDENSRRISRRYGIPDML